VLVLTKGFLWEYSFLDIIITFIVVIKIVPEMFLYTHRRHYLAEYDREGIIN